MGRWIRFLFLSSLVPWSIAKTCGTGRQCSSCQGDRKATVSLTSGSKLDVCCRGCSSQYFVYGSASPDTDAFCNCRFDDIEGDVWKGEECEEKGVTTYSHYEDMPLCCPDPQVLFEDKILGYIVDYHCARHGDCWRGSLCQSCNHSSNINGVEVCCPHCQELSIDYSDDGYCSCQSYYHTA